MNIRNIATVCAACFVGLGITAAAADARPPGGAVVVEGKRFDPETQRIVHYGDLILASLPGQKLLTRRISAAARDLCSDVGNVGFSENWSCQNLAVDSTDNQVAAAIARAHDRLAGRAVGPAVAISMVIGSR